MVDIFADRLHEYALKEDPASALHRCNYPYCSDMGTLSLPETKLQGWRIKAVAFARVV